MKRVHLLASLLVLTGCAGLIGVPDLAFDETPVDPDGGGPGANDSGPSPRDASADAPISECDTTKLATDVHHCGRCGHDCLGGTCTAGKCQSVVLKAGLANPVDIAFDAANVYVTSREDGLVARIPKDGSAAAAVATGQVKARGVTLDGANLYWASSDFEGDGTDGYFGGIWGCTLPACIDKRQVTKGDWAMNVRFANGVLYFAENNDSSIVRVKPDGSERVVLDATSSNPFSVAVDAAHVYYQSSSGLQRVPIAGSATETYDAMSTASQLGFVALDADRVYYAYTDQGGVGVVNSMEKASPGGLKTQYGTANKGSLGVAVDATSVYWTSSGTFDDFAPYANHDDGEVATCPKAGCDAAGPTILAAGLTSPGVIAVDGDAVYFLLFGTQFGSTNGELRRIAKP